MYKRQADTLGLPHERVYKTLVTTGKSGSHYVFVIPIEAELDLKKAARAVGEKSVETVSYTHLDVYKRQDIERIKRLTNIQYTFTEYLDFWMKRCV